MVDYFRVVQLPVVPASWSASGVLPVLAAFAVAACSATAGSERPDKPQVSRVLSGPNPLKCQPFVVLYRMDRAGNGDGILDSEEIPRGAESFVQRLVTESKVAASKNTPLRQVAVAWHLRARHSTGGLPKSVVIQPERSRLRRRKSPASHRDHAVNLLGRYDGNGSGSLEQDEWNRIGVGWDEADADGNGVLSLDELSDRFTAYERPPSGSGDDLALPGSPGNAPEDRHLSAHGPRHQTQSAFSRRRKSYRRRTPHERLPAGIPGWYVQMDADRDGQIMMVEYAKAWNDERLAEFNRYDFNRDGIITPRECLKAEPPGR